MTKQEFDSIVEKARLEREDELFDIVNDALKVLKDLDCGDTNENR